MTLIGLLLLIVVLGIVMYLVDKFVPMDATYKSLLRTIGVIVVILLFVIWLLGLVGYPINLGRIR